MQFMSNTYSFLILGFMIGSCAPPLDRESNTPTSPPSYRMSSPAQCLNKPNIIVAVSHLSGSLLDTHWEELSHLHRLKQEGVGSVRVSPAHRSSKVANQASLLSAWSPPSTGVTEDSWTKNYKKEHFDKASVPRQLALAGNGFTAVSNWSGIGKLLYGEQKLAESKGASIDNLVFEKQELISQVAEGVLRSALSGQRKMVYGHFEDLVKVTEAYGYTSSQALAKLKEIDAEFGLLQSNLNLSLGADGYFISLVSDHGDPNATDEAGDSVFFLTGPAGCLREDLRGVDLLDKLGVAPKVVDVGASLGFLSGILENKDEPTDGKILPLFLQANPPEDEETDPPGGGTATNVNYKKPPDYTYPDSYNNPAKAPKRHLILWGEAPATEVTIAFGVDAYQTNGDYKIYLSASPHFGQELDTNYEHTSVAAESGLAKTCKSNTHAQLQAGFKDLKPNTTYYYVATANGERSKELHFVTAPASPNVQFKIFSGGDSRSNKVTRRKMNAQLSSLLENDSNHLALIHGGDFVDKGVDCNQWLEWRNDHDLTMTNSGRVLPLLPTFGNHEAGGEKQFAQVFIDPRKKGLFYYLSRIGRLHVLVLNSEISVEGDQKDWIAKTLKSLQSLDDKGGVIIPGYHKPAYPAHKDPDTTTAWINLWEQYQVDLVLESDGHTLKQTCPIYKDSCDQERGIIYVGEGGLGVDLRKAIQKDAWYFEDGGYASSKHHIQIISIEPDRAFYEVYYDGGFHHKIELKKRNR